MLKTSTSIVANTSHISNQNHYVGWTPNSPLGDVGVFPSLSKGTLKTTNLQNHNVTSQFKLLTSMTKAYNDKDMFFLFKKPIKSSNKDENITTSPLTNTYDYEEKTEERSVFKDQESFERSIARTRREITDLAQMNDFDMFATFTFDPKKHDAYNFDECLRKLNRFIANQKRLYGDFNNIIVAEPMKDGKIHFHALLGGFTGKYHQVKSRKKGENTIECFKMDAWEKNYGFCDMEQIFSKERISNYIVKYIAKDFGTSFHEKGRKRYYASKNLIRPKKTYNQDITDLKQSGLYDLSNVQEWENDFVHITTLPKSRK